MATGWEQVGGTWYYSGLLRRRLACVPWYWYWLGSLAARLSAGPRSATREFSFEDDMHAHRLKLTTRQAAVLHAPQRGVMHRMG